MKLQEAYLCLDCETLGSNSRSCESCGSIAVYALARFIDRSKSDNSLLLSHSLAHTCDTLTVPCIACNTVIAAKH